MGWTYTNKSSHISAGTYIKENLLTWTNPGYQYKLLDGGVVKFRTYYGAVEKMDLATGERNVFAVVILLNYCRNDYYNFGYKDMDESMGPCEDNCPKRILQLLTPTDSKNANDWRERCWAKINKKKEMPKIVPNMVLQYGGKEYTVTRLLGRRGYMVSGNNGVYRLNTKQAKNAEIVSN